MSETQAGTPEATPAVSESAGTTGAGQDGSEATAEQLRKQLEDERALRLAHQEKVEKANRDAEELARLRAQQSQQQSQANPMFAVVDDLDTRIAYGDKDAIVQKQLLLMTIQQQAESRLVEEMHILGVPADKWAQVKGLVQQSNYSLPVQTALASVVPPKDTAAEAELVRLRAEVAELRKPQKQVGPTAGAASTVPAASASNSSTDTMPFSQYKSLLSQGGQAGKDAKRRKDAGELTLDYSQ